MDCRFRDLVILVFLLPLVLAGCGGRDRPAGSIVDGSDQDPVQGDWMILSLQAEADTMNQLISSSQSSQTIFYGSLGSFVGEWLLGYDTENWRSEKPLLAESYPDVSDDNLTYTFTLREGVRWHDGESFTADDVEFSAKAMMVPFVDAAPWRGYFSDLADVEVEGREVRLIVDQPFWLNDSILSSLPILPKHLYDPEGVLDGYSLPDILSPSARDDETLREFGEAFNSHPANRQPIGTGPYRFESWESGSQITLVRNDDYWGEPAQLDRVIFRFITDSTAALTSLKSGDTDFYPRMTPIQWVQQTSGADFESQYAKQNYTIPQMNFIAWNPMRPFFADKRVRRAMTMLIPRQQIVDSLRFGLAEVAVSSFNPNAPDFNPNIEAYPYDPERAVALLEEVGWVDHDGDGIRDKDGVKFSFEFLGYTGSQYIEQLLPILRDELGKVGIEMTERRLEFNIMAESTRDKQFDAMSMNWVSDLLSDPRQIWHSSSADNRGSNFVSFRNPEADQLIDDARLEFDPERRRELYWRFQEILHDEQPYTFMMYPQEAGAYHRRFLNAEFLPTRPGYDLTSWFVPEAAQRYTAAPQ